MGTMLSNVSKEVMIRPPRLVIHGKGGVGKTSFGASIPGALVMPVEDGLGKLEVAHLPRPESYVEVMNTIVELANEKHEYKALVIDTIDHVEPLVWRAVCEQKSSDGKRTYEHIEDFGYAKGFMYADPFWTRFFQGLDTLRRKGMTTVILCHNEVKPIVDPILGPYDSMAPKLHKRANALLYEWADIVGFLDMEKAAVTKEGARSRELKTAAMLGNRVLYLQDIGGFEAKNRFGLPARITVPIENPYGALRTALVDALGLNGKGEKKEAA